jgi:putative DNA primase/helicase
MKNNKKVKSLFPVEPQHLTDTTNAEKIVELFGNNLRFDHRQKRWLIWNGNIWKPDITGNIYRFAIQSARQQYQDAVKIQDLNERMRVSDWAIESENRSKLKSALSIAENLEPIADAGNDWDTNPMLLACKNGIIELTTGKLRQGRQKDRVTM